MKFEIWRSVNKDPSGTANHQESSSCGNLFCRSTPLDIRDSKFRTEEVRVGFQKL